MNNKNKKNVESGRQWTNHEEAVEEPFEERLKNLNDPPPTPNTGTLRELLQRSQTSSLIGWGWAGAYVIPTGVHKVLLRSSWNVLKESSLRHPSWVGCQ